MTGALMLRVRRALRKDPRYIARRLWLEGSIEAERWLAPRRARRLSLQDLWRRAGHASVDDLWLSLSARPFPHARRMSGIELEALQPGCVDSLRKRAERAHSNMVELLGSGARTLPADIDWLADIKTGRRWPLAFHRDIDYNNFGEPSDVKLAWELSRLQWAIPLGQAWLLDGDDRHAAKLRDLLQQWMRANPYAFSVNWSCTMEPALRILVWTWLFHACADAPSWRDTDFRAEFLRMLYLHGDFVARNLERADINGNHYTADAAGLVYAGLFFGEIGNAPHWAATGWSILSEEFHRQVFPDGVDFEASIPYHRLVTELFLYPALYRTACGERVPTAYRERLREMARFVALYSRDDGSVPLWGDADDARALPFGVQALNDHRYLVGAVALGLGQGELEPLFSGPRDELGWLLGPKVAARAPANAAPELRSRAFGQGGFYVLRSGPHHVFVDCGPLGLAGRGGHGHNDLLAFEAVIDGVHLISDCGAYLYTASPSERNHFRATAQHNTPQVDCEEINRFVHPDYLWVLHDDARHQLLQWQIDVAGTSFAGSHDGYRRLTDPVIVRRSLRLEHASGRLHLEDSFQARASHRVVSPFHAAPGVVIELAHRHADFHVAGRRFRMDWGATDGWTASVRKGRVSPSYGVAHDIQVLEFRTEGKLEPLRWTLGTLA
jgi:uncharacterized heparinase superfamily protein